MATAAAESLPGVGRSILIILMETVPPRQALIIFEYSGDFELSTFCSVVYVYI